MNGQKLAPRCLCPPVELLGMALPKKRLNFLLCEILPSRIHRIQLDELRKREGSVGAVQQLWPKVVETAQQAPEKKSN